MKRRDVPEYLQRALPAWRRQIRYSFFATLGRLGVPGMIGVGLLAGCAVLWGTAITDLEARRAQVAAELIILASAASGDAHDEALRAELAAFQAILPDASNIPTMIGQLHGQAAAAGVRVANTEFHPDESQTRGAADLPAFVVTMETVATPEASLTFVNSILAQTSNAALEAVSFKRSKLADPTLEAQWRLRFYVRRL